MEHRGTHGVPEQRAAFAGDHLLAGRIASGDADALGELFDRHGAAAVAAAKALVGDAFVTVWQRISEFDGSPDTLGSWVLALTRQHAAQRLAGH